MEHPLFVLCVNFPRQSGSFWQTPDKNGGGHLLTASPHGTGGNTELLFKKMIKMTQIIKTA